jgi:hypothetical protein
MRRTLWLALGERHERFRLDGANGVRKLALHREVALAQIGGQ